MTITIPAFSVLLIAVGGSISGFALVAYLLGSIILQLDPGLGKIKKFLSRMFFLGWLLLIVPLLISMASQPSVP